MKDFRFALRQLVKARAFTAAAVTLMVLPVAYAALCRVRQSFNEWRDARNSEVGIAP